MYKLNSLTISNVRNEFLSTKCFFDNFATVKFSVQMADNRSFDTLYYFRFLFDGGNPIMLAETLWSILRAYNVISVKVSVTTPDSAGACVFSETYLSGHGLASGCN